MVAIAKQNYSLIAIPTNKELNAKTSCWLGFYTDKFLFNLYYEANWINKKSYSISYVI